MRALVDGREVHLPYHFEGTVGVLCGRFLHGGFGDFGLRLLLFYFRFGLYFRLGFCGSFLHGLDRGGFADGSRCRLCLGRGVVFDNHLFLFGFSLFFGFQLHHAVATAGHELDFVGFLFHFAFALEGGSKQFILLLANLRVGVHLYLVPLLGKVLNEGLDAHIEVLGYFCQSETCHIVESFLLS